MILKYILVLTLSAKTEIKSIFYPAEKRFTNLAMSADAIRKMKLSPFVAIIRTYQTNTRSCKIT